MAGKALNIQAGSVLHIWCGHCRPPKWKYHVVAYTNPAIRYWLINSRPAAFQSADKELMLHQVELEHRHNTFLKHDSVLDCSTIVGGPTLSELEDAYLRDPNVLMGRIGTKARRAVRKIVEESQLLSSKEIGAILAIW